MRTTDELVERIGVERSRALIEGADVLLWLGEPDEAPAHPRLVRVHAKCDLAERASRPTGRLPVSSLTGAGIAALLDRVAELAASLLPGEDALALNRRQAMHLAEAHEALVVPRRKDIVTVAEDIRLAARRVRPADRTGWHRECSGCVIFARFASENSCFT